MEWLKFTESRPNNNELILVWFFGENDRKGEPDMMWYSHEYGNPEGYWSCEDEGEIFYPDLWCRIVPPITQ